MSASSKYTHPYSSSDIQKYLSGTLSSEEMHAMEKAALDDPFLQDALEGIAKQQGTAPDFHLREDLGELEARLENAIKHKKKALIFLLPRPLRVAAAIILLVGLGTTAFYLFLNEPARSKKLSAARFAKDSIVPSAEAKADTSRNIGLHYDNNAITQSQSFLADSGNATSTPGSSSSQANALSKDTTFLSKGNAYYSLNQPTSPATAPASSAKHDHSRLKATSTSGANADSATYSVAAAQSEDIARFNPPASMQKRMPGIAADSLGLRSGLRKDTANFYNSYSYSPADKKTAIGSGNAKYKDFRSKDKPQANAGPPPPRPLAPYPSRTSRSSSVRRAGS